MKSSDMELKRGYSFAGYTLLENIGSGATAEVWRIENESGVEKAIKIYSPSNKLSEHDQKLLKQEFDIAKNLEHDNILKLEEYGVFNNKPYIIMPLAKASLMSELQARLYKYEGESHAYFSEGQLATILYEVSAALMYLETKKIVHKDLKPDNILIHLENDDEKLVIMDFNISKSLKKKILTQTRSQNEQSSGLTPAYAAPEYLKGKEHQKSDIFSLGITLYELATGNIPNSDTLTGPAEIINNGGILAEINIKDISSDFNTLIKLCLNVDPEKRPSAGELHHWADFYINNGTWPQEINDFNNKLRKVSSGSNRRGKSSKTNDVKETVVLTGADLNIPKTISTKTKYHFFDNAFSLLGNYYFHAILGVLLVVIYIIFISWNSGNKKEYKGITYESGIENMYRVKIDNKFGLIDESGSEVIPAIYDQLTKFESGIAVIVENEQGCGYIDSSGKKLKYNSRYSKCRVIDDKKGEAILNGKKITVNFQ
jgi:serine/threonine protein kinase